MDIIAMKAQRNYYKRSEIIKIKSYDVIFITLAISNIILNYILGINYLTYILAMLLVIFKIRGKMSSESYLLYSLFVPNKYLQLLSILLFLVFTGELFSKKLSKLKALFVIYIFTVSTWNCLLYKGFFINVIFQVCVYFCILRLLDEFENHFSLNLILEVFDKMFILQIIAIIIEFLITHETMDALTGTLISAHYLGIFLVIYAYLTWKSRFAIKRNIIFWLKLIVLILGLYFVDAKHVVFIFVFSILYSKLLSKLNIKYKLTMTMIGMTFGIALLLKLIDLGALNSVIEHISFLDIYIMNDNYNKKFQFYTNTFKQLSGIHGIFGFGVGQYGSQICITMAKGIIYSWNSSLNGYMHAILPYINAISGIMTEWYTNTGIEISSMVLGYPLVSYIALVAELGIVGISLFMIILDKQYRYQETTFLIMFLILTNFDTYFEIPCVLIMILVAESVNIEKMETEKSNI